MLEPFPREIIILRERFALIYRCIEMSVGLIQPDEDVIRCWSGAVGSLFVMILLFTKKILFSSFRVDAFLGVNGFNIFSCLISGRKKAGKIRKYYSCPEWETAVIKLEEYSTAFPRAPATHFAAMSPRA